MKRLVYSLCDVLLCQHTLCQIIESTVELVVNAHKHSAMAVSTPHTHAQAHHRQRLDALMALLNRLPLDDLACH